MQALLRRQEWYEQEAAKNEANGQSGQLKNVPEPLFCVSFTWLRHRRVAVGRLEVERLRSPTKMAESSVGAGVVVVVVVEVAAAAARPGVDGVVFDIGISVVCLFLKWSWSLFQMGTKCIRRHHQTSSASHCINSSTSVDT